eukprot:TRINITY_DN41295_c0_g1_i1.p1 TRINITY_DN41295_c0_g1~~TRINITY_DN41295_c0_g1_i1.p1  ORF type:complete len:793 (+),score=128.32 TRINITY_DN41295_c0_g1_i1:175-2553(+)
MHRQRITATNTPGHKSSPQARRVVLVAHGERTQRETNDILREDRGRGKPSLRKARDLSESLRHKQQAMHKKSPESPRPQRQVGTKSHCKESGREWRRSVEADNAKDHRAATRKNSVRTRGLPTFKQISALSSKLRSNSSASDVTRRDSAEPDFKNKSAPSFKVRRRSAAADAAQRGAADTYFEDGDQSWTMDPCGPEDLETRINAGRDDVGGTEAASSEKHPASPGCFETRMHARLDDAASTRMALIDEDPRGLGDFDMRTHAVCDDVAGADTMLSSGSCLASASSASAPFHAVDALGEAPINTSNNQSQPFRLPLPPIPKARSTVDPVEFKMCFPTLTPLVPSAGSRPNAQIEEEPQQSDDSTHSVEPSHAFQRWSELLLQEAKLKIHKRRAVACEDYPGAGHLKSLLQELEPCLAAARDFALLCGVPSISYRLEEQKSEAVAKEDYEEASRLKRRISQLSTARDSASLHEAMLGALELARDLGALDDGPALVEELIDALADHEIAATAAAVPVAPAASAAFASESASETAAAKELVAPAASLMQNTCELTLAKHQLHAPPPEELCSQHASLGHSKKRNETQVKENADKKVELSIESKRALDEVSESKDVANDRPTHVAAAHESDVEQLAAARRRVQQHIREEMNKQLQRQHQAKRGARLETSSAGHESHLETSTRNASSDSRCSERLDTPNAATKNSASDSRQIFETQRATQDKFESSKASCPIPGIKLDQFVTMSKQEIWQKAWDASWRAEDALGQSDDEAKVYKIARRTWKAWVAQRNALARGPEVES